MKESVPGFESEMRVSAKWVIVVLLVVAVSMLLAGEGIPDDHRRIRVELLGVFLYPCLALIWVLESWNPRIGRVLLVVSLGAMVAAAGLWMRVPGTLALLAVPTGLAAAMLGLVASVLTAIGSSALLLTLSNRLMADIGGAELLVALAAVWGSFGVMCAAYRPLYQLKHWMWEYLRRAQSLLDESLDRKAELARALENLSNANRQLALANERLSVLRAVAEEAQQSKAAFVARVSHEFRTPLNMIIGLVSIMVENPEVYAEELPPDLWSDLGVVHRNCQHLSSMISDVLDLSQAEAGRLTLRRQWCDLSEIVESVTVAVRPMVDKKQLDLQLSLPDSLPAVYCDGTRIRQVLLNVVSNAARFTARGEIKVRVSERDHSVVIGVTDTGPGISTEDTERIFEPFYQGTMAGDRGGQIGRAGQGSGLGLSISRQLVHLHGGRMWLESELGAGASFYFTLPISSPAEPAERPDRWIIEDWEWRERAFETSHAYSAGQLLRPRIVVYDETGGLDAELTHYDEIEFVRVSTLDRAADALSCCPAHALILNATEPRDLFALVERARQTHPETPVIGCSIPRQIEHAVQSGARGHLTKPVTRADLERAIRQVDGPVQRVLIVDDEPEVLRLWQRTLGVYDATITVATASTGQQALEALRAAPFDLVLLDVVMPGMDGWQVLERIQQDVEIRDVPVIVVSGKDPVQKLPQSGVLMAALGQGLPVNCLLRCSLDLAALLLRLDRVLDLAPG